MKYSPKSWFVLPILSAWIVFLVMSIEVDASAFPWFVGEDHSGMEGQNQTVVSEAYRDAAIVGFDKSKQDEAYEDSSHVDDLEADNEALRDDVFSLTLRVQKLEKRLESVQNAPTETRTVYIEGSGSVDISDIEHRLHVVERVISMLEVNIGSTHAYINEQLDPVLRAIELR